jgi:predicted DNA-binding WGR domain protein
MFQFLEILMQILNDHLVVRLIIVWVLWPLLSALVAALERQSSITSAINTGIPSGKLLERKTPLMENITLYFRQGSSDKVYQAAIEAKDGGYVVNFAYGRRGTTLQTGTKTQAPVDYAAAKGIYDKLIKEKTAKGYTPGADGTPYQHTDKQQEATGINCQLLNAVEESDIPRLIRDPAYWMQEKHDGRRLLVQKHDGINDGHQQARIDRGCPRNHRDRGEGIRPGLHHRR